MMEGNKKVRKLNYQDEAIAFMKRLIRSGKQTTAKGIKSVLLEVCRIGVEYSNLEPYSDVKNMYRLHIPALNKEDGFQQGFRVIIIIMEGHVLATSIGPEYS